MPAQHWDDSAPRFRPRTTLYGPVVVSFLIQVPAAAGMSVWLHAAPRWAIPGILLAAASALCLLAARALPGPTVAVVAILTAVDLFVPPGGGPPFVALAFAIIGAVVRGAQVWALVSVGAVWLIALVIGGAGGELWHPFRIAVATLVLGLCFAVGAGIRHRGERVARHRAQLAERRIAGRQAERDRIARELHDVLAHSLSQIAVQSGVGLHLFDREPERAREALANIRALSATGLDEVRGVLAILRGDDAAAGSVAPLSPQPQLGDMPALVTERSGHGLAVALDDGLNGQAPPSSVQTAAYRIVQEALTNVVRHSEASRAVVRLRRDGAMLMVTVDDDGVGRGERPDGGGIRGMRERAALLGGTTQVEHADLGGTRIVALLPWEGVA